MDPSSSSSENKKEEESLAEPLLSSELQEEQAAPPENNHQHDSWSKGTPQPPAYRDVGFAIAFFVHFCMVVALACMTVTTGAWGDNEDDNQRFLATSNDLPHSIAYGIAILALCVGTVVVLLALAGHGMSVYPVELIQATLIVSTVFPLVIGLGIFASDPSGTGVLACLPLLILSLCLCCYARTVWGRIPYAACNLRAALAAVQAHKGLVLVSLGGLCSLTVWMVVWGLAMLFLGLSPHFWTQPDTTTHCHSSSSSNGDDGGSGDCPGQSLNGLGATTSLFLTISFYWVVQVLRNVVRTTVAGTVGTWWFDDSGTTSSCCSRAVSDSLYRSTTLSFGSICFGSLVVAVLHTMRDALRRASRNRRVSATFSCVLECILLYIEKLVEYFNKWSFIYVGLYGYGYVEASKTVMQLFRERSWMPVIADDLVNRLLGMMSLSVSLLAGLVCALVALIMGNGSEALFAGFLGMIMAWFLSNIMIGIISSAVDTVIVCFAESPAEFRTSHPELAAEMERTWTEAWRDPQSGLILISLGAGPGIV